MEVATEAEGLVAEWRQAVSPDGRSYWWHTVSQETSWTDPTISGGGGTTSSRTMTRRQRRASAKADKARSRAYSRPDDVQEDLRVDFDGLAVKQVHAKRSIAGARIADSTPAVPPSIHQDESGRSDQSLETMALNQDTHDTESLTDGAKTVVHEQTEVISATGQPPSLSGSTSGAAKKKESRRERKRRLAREKAAQAEAAATKSERDANKVLASPKKAPENDNSGGLSAEPEDCGESTTLKAAPTVESTNAAEPGSTPKEETEPFDTAHKARARGKKQEVEAMETTAETVNPDGLPDGGRIAPNESVPVNVTEAAIGDLDLPPAPARVDRSPHTSPQSIGYDPATLDTQTEGSELEAKQGKSATIDAASQSHANVDRPNAGHFKASGADAQLIVDDIICAELEHQAMAGEAAQESIPDSPGSTLSTVDTEQQPSHTQNSNVDDDEALQAPVTAVEVQTPTLVVAIADSANFTPEEMPSTQVPGASDHEIAALAQSRSQESTQPDSQGAVHKPSVASEAENAKPEDALTVQCPTCTPCAVCSTCPEKLLGVADEKDIQQLQSKVELLENKVANLSAMLFQYQNLFVDHHKAVAELNKAVNDAMVL
eukprot:INCI4859.1.p1 GENE.INCI4859.1~~INCI4859.1.p1  ORF type:complete len:604 (-),score=137.75 INCI4859.1:32-1843(-)